MLEITRWTQAIHAVHDLKLAEELYTRVFDARKFHEGPLGEGEESSSLLAFHKAGVRVVALDDLQRQVGDGLITPREGFHGAGFQVADLEAAAAHFAEHGVRVIRRSPDRLFIDPRDSIGVLLEFRDRPLPNDPRLAPGWPLDHWKLEHPMEIEDLLLFSALVKDSDAASAFCQGVLGGKPVGESLATDFSIRMDTFAVGDTYMRMMRPRAGSEMDWVAKTFGGGQGMHALTFRSGNLPRLTKHLIGNGIGIYPGPKMQRMPFPRAMVGARFLFVDPDPLDPRWAHPESPVP